MKNSILINFCLILASTLQFSMAGASGSSGGAPSGGGTSGSGSSGSGRAAEASSVNIDQAREAMRERMKNKAAQSAASAQAGVFDHEHAEFDDLLKKHVVSSKNGSVTKVNYKDFDRNRLKAYLTRLSAVSKKEFDGWSRDNQLAFLINAYNAFTIELILQNYPVKSIKDIGSFLRSPWKIKFFKLFAEDMHLDQVEHSLIRGSDRYNEPRIHFAVNCASIGCPALLPEAFLGKTIEAQLEKATSLFLADPERNRFNSTSKSLEISKIFDWYKGDFEKGHNGIKSVPDFLARYADSLATQPGDRTLIREKNAPVSHLDYDWKLNDAAM